jgi:hypothetical protein
MMKIFRRPSPSLLFSIQVEAAMDHSKSNREHPLFPSLQPPPQPMDSMASLQQGRNQRDTEMTPQLARVNNPP